MNYITQVEILKIESNTTMWHIPKGNIVKPHKDGYRTDAGCFFDGFSVENTPKWFKLQEVFIPKNGDEVTAKVCGNWEKCFYIGKDTTKSGTRWYVNGYSIVKTIETNILYWAKDTDIKPIEEHTCNHCGAQTTQPDSECYKAPKETIWKQFLNELEYENKERDLRNKIELLQLKNNGLEQINQLNQQRIRHLNDMLDKKNG